MKEYKGFWFECESKEAEDALIAYIDSLGDLPDELPNVGEENYANWRCDYDFDGVKMLVLPESIKRIGKCVFAQSKIQNLVAEGVVHIDELAFYNTKVLESVSAPNCEMLISTDLETGELTEFSDCFNHSHVRVLNLPKVEVVGRYCFYDMPNIVELNLPRAHTMLSHSVYGNPNLKGLMISSVKNAPSSLVTMNPRLQRIDVSGLQSASATSFYGNGVELDLGEGYQGLSSDEKLTMQEQSKLQEREVFEYDYSYNGFHFNLVDGLSEQEIMLTLLNLQKEIDVWVEQAQIPDSENMNTNESGHDCLANVKDIFVPDKIYSIGNYAFAKMYALESVIAPSVKIIGDHAFYCDSAVRYAEFGDCEKLTADAFNGMSYDYLESEVMPKIFIPKVKSVGKHAFWQTGFVLIDMPACENVEISAFDENGALKKVIVARAGELAFIDNPVLAEVIETSNMSKVLQ